ncbi:hypothetical protein DFJ74DRAFT_656981 [Hyaloraphidium curvatum]|nr:hypothetical protein DFJ74DRAFT_656981 [Hyaloraphidium curvatum]
MAANGPTKSEDAAKAEKIVADAGSKFVRLLWTDFAALTRCRVIPAERIFSSVADKGTPVFGGAMSLPMMYDSVAPGMGDAGVSGGVVMKPDFKSMKAIPWYKNHSMVMGNLYTSEHKPWGLCPRTFLAKQLAVFKEKYGYEVIAGVENEFIFYTDVDAEGCAIAVNKCNYSETAGLMGNMAAVMDEIVTAMIDVGIPLNQYHTECSDGQYEITTSPLEAMELADATIFIRDAVKSIAAKHGMKATFSPKVYADQAGSASHVHFSFRDIKTGENVYPDFNDKLGISKHGQAFMAGILEHLPSLVAVTLPSAASQFRVVDSAWAGVYTAWGYENKETPVRVTEDTFGKVNNVEIKCIDGTSNIYLALGIILAAGLDGMERGLSLPVNTQCDPADLSPEEQKARGIVKLPNTMEKSLELFAADPLWKTALGEEMRKVFILARQNEAQYFKDKSIEDIRRWHLLRY